MYTTESRDRSSYPGEDADARHRHRRLRRRLDRLDRSLGSLKVGPQSAGADPGPDLLRQGRHRADRHRRGHRARPPAGRADRRRDRRSTSTRPAPAYARLGRAARHHAGGGRRRRHSRSPRANQVVRHPPGDDDARPRPGDYAWSRSAAPAGCSPPRWPTSSASTTVISSARPRQLSAPSACMSPTSSATTSARSCAASRRPIRRRSRRPGTSSSAAVGRTWRGGHAARPTSRSSAVADVRYFGEGHEVQVARPGGARRRGGTRAHVEGFHDVHDRTFGFHYEGEQDVELVNLRVQAVGGCTGRRCSAAEPAEPGAARALRARGRSGGEGGLGRLPALRARTELADGQTHRPGPAIVEEYGSTTVVRPGWRAPSTATAT